MISEAEYDKQMEIWEELYNRVCDLLEQYGKEDPLGRSGDYWVIDEYWGHPQVKTFIFNLELLKPQYVRALQTILREFPGWEIVATVCVPGTENVWPDMGLFIHAQDIVDDLKREYLPPEFYDYRY